MPDKNVNSQIKNLKLRHRLDEESGDFYFSIVDVIEMLNLSKNSQNYWKVLKNRLKKRDFELVTYCNQLKMKAGDGKYYLTDVATSDTILKIINLICPKKVVELGEFLNQIENKNTILPDSNIGEESEELSTVSVEEGEIQVDMLIEENYLLVRAMLAGVYPSEIFISVNYNNLTIKANRPKQNNKLEDNYDIQELFWGKISRNISLPFEVDIDRVEATFDHGLLIIKLFILDKTRTKIIKVRSLV